MEASCCSMVSVRRSAYLPENVASVTRFVTGIVIAVVSCLLSAWVSVHAEEHPQGLRPSERRLMRELQSRLRYELVWQGSWIPVRAPLGGSATLFVHMTSDRIAYCSLDLGNCAQYFVVDGHLDQRIKEARCSHDTALCGPGGIGIKSVFAFSAKANTASAGLPKLPGIFGGGLAGVPQPGGGFLWESRIVIENREAVLEWYRHTRSERFDGLLAHLRERLRDSDYRSVTVACFATSDPDVHIYGDRRKAGPIAFSLTWNDEREEWLHVGMVEQSQSKAAFEQLRKTIDSIACATISFEKETKE